ncbi:hypothetical protein [Janthinobacterium sp. MDT1-19]|uniref:hypothetical protein n=1 Tax=Janthinobacterium sp. MDT1-19 TaxID=1259339 RepID=UPI003F1E92DB
MNIRKRKKSHAAASSARVRGHSGTLSALEQQVNQLQEAVDKLTWRAFYHELATPVVEPAALLIVGERYVKASSDGWVNVMMNGIQTAVASGTRIAFSNSAGGRDFGAIREGVLQGRRFDVPAGYLMNTYARFDNLIIRVSKRAGAPLLIGGVSYDLELKLTYAEGGSARSAGPFAAKTDPGNPLPNGDHAIEIPDFPHAPGSGYGPRGTVWFRIGHSGDRYLHPGRVSAGCITCAPEHWEGIYQVAHSARTNDDLSVGLLKMV